MPRVDYVDREALRILNLVNSTLGLPHIDEPEAYGLAYAALHGIPFLTDNASPKVIARLAKVLGLELDVESYLKAVEECARKLSEDRELRTRSADWAYIESRPEPLKTALKPLVETGDVKLVSAVT